MESDGNCITETLPETGGEEKCRIIRPWVKGHHLYSWFFTLDTRKERLAEWSAVNATRFDNGTVVYDQYEPVATLILMGVNRCFDIC